MRIFGVSSFFKATKQQLYGEKRLWLRYVQFLDCLFQNVNFLLFEVNKILILYTNFAKL